MAYSPEPMSNSEKPKHREGEKEVTAKPPPITSRGDDESTAKAESFVQSVLFHLLYAPTGKSGLQIGAVFRIGFALIILYDRLLLITDLEFFFDPEVGVLTPYSAIQNETFAALLEDGHAEKMPVTAIFQYFDAAHDPMLVQLLHYGSIVQAILLLLGILPRFQVFCLFLNLVSFRHRSIIMIYDNQDILLLATSFYLLFLPLHHWSIFSSKHTTIKSWPIWPFRLIQWQMCCIYTGAGIGKLSFPDWWEGTSMYTVIHQQDFFGGLFAPDWIFNVAGVLQVMTWSSVVLESICWIFVWPLATRKLIVVHMWMLHLGIDLAMNLHIFQWVSILGWCSFLVVPEGRSKEQRKAEAENPSPSSASSFASITKRLICHTAFPLLVLVSLVAETAPISEIYRMTSDYDESVWPTLESIQTVQDSLSGWARSQFMEPLGLQQNIWNMYSNPSDVNSRIVAKISFEEDMEDSYWTSTKWTKLSALEKKHIYRQVLFWNSLHFEPIIQHALCHRLAREHKSAGTIRRIVLKLISVTTPPYPEEEVKSWMDSVRQTKFVGFRERMLYVYYPSTIPGEGEASIQNRRENFLYAWDDTTAGIWWDDLFYAKSEGRDEFVLVNHSDVVGSDESESDGWNSDEL